MYTLVVVDMQAAFHAALFPKVQESCKQAIRKAIRNRADIVFVEFMNQGPTLPCLTDLTKKYDRVFHVLKKSQDGSAETLAAVKKNNLHHKKFRVCGVYTDCCVKATLDGLHKLAPLSQLELLHKACGPSYDGAQEWALGFVRAMKRVQIKNV